MPDVQLPASKNQINKAGRTVRRWHDAGRPPSGLVEVNEARQLISSFRAVFQRPMTGVNMGRRSFIKTAGCSEGWFVAQRLKRLEQIELKLHRFPQSALVLMEDVGGLRAVLPTQDDVALLLAHVRRRERKSSWSIHRVRDYVVQPKTSGYRAVHVVVSRDSCLLEVQLRTETQHAWAEFVEEMGRRTGYLLKEGQGPDDLTEWLRVIAEVLALEGEGTLVPKDMYDRLENLREQVQHYFAPRP